MYLPANIPSRSTLAAMKALPLSFLATAQIVALKGALTPGDGEQGLFYWDPASAAADDTASSPFYVVQPSAVVGNGRFIRLPLTTPTATELGGVLSSAAPAHQFSTGVGLTGASTFAQPAAGDLQNIVDQTILGNNIGVAGPPLALSASAILTMLKQYASAAKTANYTLLTTDFIVPVNGAGGSFQITMPKLLKGLYLIPKIGSDSNPVFIYDDASPTPNQLFSVITGGSAIAFCWSDGTNAYANRGS